MKLLIKLLITIALLIVLNIIFSAFEPTISSQVAVGQLSDSYDSNASMTIYQQLKQFTWVVYLLIVGLVFSKDIRKVINLNKKIIK